MITRKRQLSFANEQDFVKQISFALFDVQNHMEINRGMNSNQVPLRTKNQNTNVL